MNVFITRVIPQAGLRLLHEAGITTDEWTELRSPTPEELVAHCRAGDALLSAGQNRIDKAFLQTCRHLKVIALMSVGYDNVDLAEANRLGIPVSNTPGVLNNATADTAFLLMLAASRKAFYHHRRIGEGHWNFYEPTAGLGMELNGKTLGVFGLGKIGFELARKCVGAFGMKVVYHNRSANPEAERRLHAVKVSFEELLAASDVLSVHASLTEETRDRFNAHAFRNMKRNAIFINTARGAVHNEPDLTEALLSGAIWGAGLDVTNPEPMHPANPLLTLPNVAILPHIGSATVEAREGMAILAARNIIAAARGLPLPTPVR